MSVLSEQELQTSLQQLKQDLSGFPEGSDSLDIELESAAKHIPAYLKIVKSHIEQLRSVLELENHNHRTLENAGLAKPVQQLIEMFKILEDADIELIEELAETAKNWVHVPVAEEQVTAKQESDATQVQEV